MPPKTTSQVYNGRVYDLLAVDNNCGLLRPLPVRHSTADVSHDPGDNPESAAASEDDFPSSNSGRAARRHSVSNGDGVCVVGLSSHRVEGSQQVNKNTFAALLSICSRSTPLLALVSCMSRERNVIYFRRLHFVFDNWIVSIFLTRSPRLVAETKIDGRRTGGKDGGQKCSISPLQ